MAGFKLDVAIRQIALNSVMNPTEEDRLAEAFRWYSRTFHTPLVEVPSLDLFHVLHTYWVCHYEKMRPEELWDERCELLMSDEERRARIQAEEMEDVDRYLFAKQVEEEEAENQKRRAASARAEMAKMAAERRARAPGKTLIGDPSEKLDPEILEAIKEQSAQQSKPMSQKKQDVAPPPEPAAPPRSSFHTTLPENFKIEFADDVDWDDLESQNAMNPASKPRSPQG